MAAVCCLVGAALFALAGCASGSSGTASGSAETSSAVGHGMGAIDQTVTISATAFRTRPKPWVLATPDSAVRSYLDWTSYAYRITESIVATPTMSAGQEVHVDSYIQLNLQKSQLIDQSLESITFGKPSVEGTHTLVPVKEKWSYRYVSTKEVGKTIAGPYSASYDSTYTLVKSGKDWIIDSVEAKAIGEVK